MSQASATRPSPPLELPLSPPRTRLGSLRISERRILLMLGDLLMISVALGVALWQRIPWVSSVYPDWRALLIVELRWWLLLWALWIPAAITADCYSLPRAASTVNSVIHTAACALVVALVYLLIPGISAPLTYSRLSWFLFALLAMGGVGAWRAIYGLAISQRSFTRRVIVVGAGTSGRAFAGAVDAAYGATGIELVGFVDDDPDLLGQNVLGRRVLADSDRLLTLTDQYDVDEVVVAVSNPHSMSPDLIGALVRCWEQGVSIVPMSAYFETVTGAVPVEHLGQDLFALVGNQDQVPMRVWLAIRRLIDIVVALVGLLAVALLTPLVWVAMAIDGPGPLFYLQTRVGRGGQTFRIIKFRSMIPHAEPNGATWASLDDPRVTRLGKVLRKTRIDELPQFVNVLLGSMTLIGPRPERPEFVEQLGTLLPYYAIRHSVKPGLTGWAQVFYHYGNSVEDALAKLQYDLYYVKHRGPVLDALIALHTLRVLATLRGV
jgi:exopolysaccharide biosynthesis polyprenyl glycosylphosphotransferase